ncbi:MAG: hypothetical protein ACREDZ_14345 [Kiloniellales bacterium]
MFAQILTVVPLMLPPIPATGVYDELYAHAPSVERIVAPIAISQPFPTAAALELSSFFPASGRQPTSDFSRYDSAPSLQRLVFAAPALADLALHAPLPTQALLGGATQLPVKGFTLSDVTDDLAWRRETAGRLRGVFQ